MFSSAWFGGEDSAFIYCICEANSVDFWEALWISINDDYLLQQLCSQMGY